MTDPWLRRLTALTLLAACGCSELSNCPDAEERRTIPNEPGTTDVANLYFESAPSYGPLEHFPAKSELRFEHGLGVTPLLWKAYLSFWKDGTDEDGNISEVAGNLGTAQCIDRNVIVLKNDTCERGFYVRVVAMGQSLFPEGKECPE